MMADGYYSSFDLTSLLQKETTIWGTEIQSICRRHIRNDNSSQRQRNEGVHFSPQLHSWSPSGIRRFILQRRSMTNSDRPLGLWVFERRTSDIDWCEENNSFVPYIEEFWNTISNGLFLVLGVIYSEFWNTISNGLFLVLGVIYSVLHRDFAVRCQCTKSLLVAHFLVFVVGFGSALFHATLSYFGQLLDEIAILWVLFGFVSATFYRRSWKISKPLFQFLAWLLCVLLTPLTFIFPVVNAFALMTMCACVFWYLSSRTRKMRPVYFTFLCNRLQFNGPVLFGMALFCWINDRIPVMCHLWHPLRQIPYLGFLFQLHAWWHILIACACSLAGLQMLLLLAGEEYAEIPWRVAFWPSSHALVGIPYVTPELPQRQGKHNPKEIYIRLNTVGEEQDQLPQTEGHEKLKRRRPD
eukprot:g31968.t1